MKIPIRGRGSPDEAAPGKQSPTTSQRPRLQELPLNQAAITAAFRINPDLIYTIPQSDAVSRQDQDAQEAHIHEIMIRCKQGVASDYKEVDATMVQDPELDGLILIAKKPLDLANFQSELHTIRDQGLANTVGGRFPVQNMTGLVMAVAGYGPPEAKVFFETFCENLKAIYTPRRLIKWFHEDVKLPDDFHGYVLPLIDYTEAAFEAANPGVQETAEYAAYLSTSRST